MARRDTRRTVLTLSALTLLACITGAEVNAGGTTATATTGTLPLRAELRLVSRLAECPPGVTASACATRTVTGVFPGLGSVSGSSTWRAAIDPPACTLETGKSLAHPVRLSVAGKGTIEIDVADAPSCTDLESLRTQTQGFKVTGGTGVYAGASGSGTLERTLGFDSGAGRIGTESWSGNLIVPGLEFDTTPPTLNGTVAKTVRAPRGARRTSVRYAVTSQDAIDGAIPVSCKPRSGSAFRIGRTVVSCSATDRSGNTRTARFTVIVRRR
jgi:HYR domain-containing protein